MDGIGSLNHDPIKALLRMSGANKNEKTLRQMLKIHIEKETGQSCAFSQGVETFLQQP